MNYVKQEFVSPLCLRAWFLTSTYMRFLTSTYMLTLLPQGLAVMTQTARPAFTLTYHHVEGIREVCSGVANDRGGWFGWPMTGITTSTITCPTQEVGYLLI